ncbi:MAG: GNAT family N-acetyltransferase [Synechococcales cyanobacterium]
MRPGVKSDEQSGSRIPGDGAGQSPGRAVTIQQATLADLGSLVSLFDAYRQFYGSPPDQDLARVFLHQRLERQDSVIFLAKPIVAEQGESPLGFCQIYPTFCSLLVAPIGVLYDLFVTPVARRQGVGRELLGEAVTYARAAGYARLDLSTAQTNRAAQALYEGLGWQRDTTFWVYSLRL